MLHSIFHTVGDYSEAAAEEDLMGEEMLDDNVADTESLNGDVVDNNDNENRQPLTKKFYCGDCCKLFTTNKTLRRHIRRIHNKTPDPIPTRNPPVAKIADGSAVCCRDCGIWFSAKKNLLRHIRTSTTHKQQAKKKLRNEHPEVIELPTLDTIYDTLERSMTDYAIEDTTAKRVFNEEIDIMEVNVEPPSDDHTLNKTTVDEDCIEDIRMDQADENMDLDSNSVDDELQKDHNVSTAGTDKEVNIRKNVDNVSLVSLVKKYPCEECGQQFTKKSNVYRHMRRIHRMNIALQKGKEVSSPAVRESKAVKAFACEKCDQKFTKHSDLERHVQSSHRKSDIAASNRGSVKDITCEHCLQHFASRSNLLRHIRRQHLAKTGLPITNSKNKLKSLSSIFPVAVRPCLVLDKNLRLGDYPFLKNMLPTSYNYNLRCYSILTEDNPALKYKCFDATLQFHCTAVGESKHWVSLFEKTNRLSFDCKSSLPQENEPNASHLQYKCSVKGCPSLLILSMIDVIVQRKNVVRVTVRIVHKHNHQWDPPRLDLSQLVEAVIEEQDMIDSDSEQINIAPDPSFYVPTTTSSAAESQPSVMTLYFDKGDNSYVTQNMSLITNGDDGGGGGAGAGNDPLNGLVLVANRSKKDAENGGSATGEFDAVGQFKRVCADMAVMIQQDPQYFAEAVQQFEASFDRVCSSKYDLLKALCKFGNADEISETPEP